MSAPDIAREALQAILSQTMPNDFLDEQERIALAALATVEAHVNQLEEQLAASAQRRIALEPHIAKIERESTDPRVLALPAALARIEAAERRVEALNTENASLNTENRNLLEQWSARGASIEALEAALRAVDDLLAGMWSFSEDGRAEMVARGGLTWWLQASEVARRALEKK